MTTQLSQHDEFDEERQDDDFLAFWSQHRAKQDRETKTILGVTIEVPTELPLGVEDLYNELSEQDITSLSAVEPLVELLFGRDVFGVWKRNGITLDMLQVLFAWAMSNGAGKPISFEEAAVVVAEAEATGKARNRAARRASSKTLASARGGRSSSRTSAASTASKRKTSRS